jgi:hypothetical protein
MTSDSRAEQSNKAVKNHFKAECLLHAPPTVRSKYSAFCRQTVFIPRIKADNFSAQQ